MRWFILKITKYRWKGPKLKAAVAADLHGRPTEELITALRSEQPDVILIPGDLCTVGDDKPCDSGSLKSRNDLQGQKNAIEFLNTAVTISPVFCSLGNHETGCDEEHREKIKSSGAVLLENEWTSFRGIWIGGQNSAKICEGLPPDTEWLQHSPEGYKILLCHHPEYRDLVENNADLIVSGHTHGGQWQLFGRGVFAPGQGLFPKYSRGQYGSMIVSAGLSNTVWVPRLFNPPELVIIELEE